MMCHKPWGLNIFFVTPLLFSPLRRRVEFAKEYPRPLIGRDESRDQYHVTVTSYKMAAAMFWRDLVATCVREFTIRGIPHGRALGGHGAMLRNRLTQSRRVILTSFKMASFFSLVEL